MVANMLAWPSPPELFVSFLARHSEGVPFFVAAQGTAGEHAYAYRTNIVPRCSDKKLPIVLAGITCRHHFAGRRR